jgi:glutathione S-transferase
MELYGRNCALNVQKVMWLLEELHLPYTQHEVGGPFGGLDNPTFRALNPLGKVPVLIEDNRAIWESHTILRYLAANYGSGQWWPSCPYERSLFERWQDWMQVSFQPAFMTLFWGYYRQPEADRNADQIAAGLTQCQECLRLLDEHLANQSFLAGEQLSLADISTGVVFYRLTTQGIDIRLGIHVARWYKRLQVRDAYQKAVMTDYSTLKGRQIF